MGLCSLEEKYAVDISGFFQGPILFDIFANYLDERIERMLMKFVNETKLGEIVNTTKDRQKIQKGLEKLEH